MGKIYFDTATTINGWIADENNSLEWLFTVPGGPEPDDELMPTGAAVMVEGSTTYQWLLDAGERVSDFHGNTPVFVFTTRDLPVREGDNITFVAGPVADVLPTIREVAGDGDIWVIGGGDLAGQFIDAGALDELRLSVAPVALTGGAPLLPRRLESDRLRLVEAKAVGQFARLVYEVSPQR